MCTVVCFCPWSGLVPVWVMTEMDQAKEREQLFGVPRLAVLGLLGFVLVAGFHTCCLQLAATAAALQGSGTVTVLINAQCAVLRCVPWPPYVHERGIDTAGDCGQWRESGAFDCGGEPGGCQLWEEGKQQKGRWSPQ